jgi:hypothetical protein
MRAVSRPRRITLRKGRLFFQSIRNYYPNIVVGAECPKLLGASGNRRRRHDCRFQASTGRHYSAPSIEVDFRGSQQDLCPVSWFMSQVSTALIDAFEMITVHMCSENIQTFGGIFPMIIRPVPKKYKAGWYARFAYGMYYQNDEFIPGG